MDVLCLVLNIGGKEIDYKQNKESNPMNLVVLIRPIIQTIFGIILISLAMSDKALPWEYKLPFIVAGTMIILIGWILLKRDLNRKKRTISDEF